MSKIDKIKKAARKFRNWLFYESDMKSILLLLTKIYIFFIKYFFLFIEIIMSLFMKTNIKESRFFNNLFIENEKTEILVLGNSRIGDTILSTSLINHLLQNNPEADFTIVTSTISKDIFQDMPRLKSLIVIDKMKYKRHWYRIWEIVKDTKWELVVDLRSSILSYFLETKERKVFN